MNDRAARPTDCRTILQDHLRPELFRALCDPNRLTLVARFASSTGPLTVTEASTCCGVHISGVSRHLAILRDAGVLQATKEGREVRYELDCGALASALRQMADALETCRAVCRAQNEETSHECCGPQCG
jgi:DNA-binding transcriptional ArsR family regulator